MSSNRSYYPPPKIDPPYAYWRSGERVPNIGQLPPDYRGTLRTLSRTPPRDRVVHRPDSRSSSASSQYSEFARNEPASRSQGGNPILNPSRGNLDGHRSFDGRPLSHRPAPIRHNAPEYNTGFSEHSSARDQPARTPVPVRETIRPSRHNLPPLRDALRTVSFDPNPDLAPVARFPDTGFTRTGYSLMRHGTINARQFDDGIRSNDHRGPDQTLPPPRPRR
ncbi:hypothetical protein MMC09_000581 [Bachmanniomyces sp. S44760]|nr:hypothetical protein [Bachmanniomyces sp. S44760]